jgi:hypothetical protein
VALLSGCLQNSARRYLCCSPLGYVPFSGCAGRRHSRPATLVVRAPTHGAVRSWVNAGGLVLARSASSASPYAGDCQNAFPEIAPIWRLTTCALGGGERRRSIPASGACSNVTGRLQIPTDLLCLNRIIVSASHAPCVLRGKGRIRQGPEGMQTPLPGKSSEKELVLTPRTRHWQLSHRPGPHRITLGLDNRLSEGRGISAHSPNDGACSDPCPDHVLGRSVAG